MGWTGRECELNGGARDAIRPGSTRQRLTEHSLRTVDA